VTDQNKADKKAAAAKKADAKSHRAARDRDFEKQVGKLGRLIRRKGNQ
jgi:hypothetical protein